MSSCQAGVSPLLGQPKPRRFTDGISWPRRYARFPRRSADGSSRPYKPELLSALPASERQQLAGRIVWISTANASD